MKGKLYILYIWLSSIRPTVAHKHTPHTHTYTQTNSHLLIGKATIESCEKDQVQKGAFINTFIALSHSFIRWEKSNKK